ncbi:hypothetical protein PHYPO_G00009100 [Pangasianodon hypophthalmus]|uniref:Uncharacterized protein n=1 Tax=Pangasianodon hypophthalmus TaxID=310915 RepID=A0A5N5Q6W4_PANHP|nr:hypothetical protein PHYPO_G00009100 [Pangasianodon hypophthalmus]
MTRRLPVSFLLLVFLSLLVGCSLASTQPCSVENNITCDSMGNATLDTAAFHDKYKHCDWTSIDKKNTLLKEVTPFLNVTVQCSLSEFRLKVYCITPKYEVLACYKLVNETSGETGEQSSDEASHHRARGFVFAPVGLFLVVLFVLAGRLLAKHA